MESNATRRRRRQSGWWERALADELELLDVIHAMLSQARWP